MRHARRLVVFAAALVVVASPSFAAVPTTMNVQGRLTDAGGTPLPAGTKTLTFKIFDSEAAGTEIWSGGAGEDHSVTSDDDGLWNTNIGTTIPIPASVFADSVRWLQVTVDDGVNPVTTLPRIRLVTGPFAYAAERVTAVDGAAGGTITSKVAIGPGTTNNGLNAFAAGQNNTADGDNATVGGGMENAASQQSTTVAGGAFNSASDQNATVGGGARNAAFSSYTTVSGGLKDTALAVFSTIAGGADNLAGASASTISGGWNNRTRGAFSVIAGGGGSDADSNAALADHSVVSGGRSNVAGGIGSVVGGGEVNSAAGDNATVGGGTMNSADGSASTVGGGLQDTASAPYATVSGGQNNVATGSGATIGGGRYNRAYGNHSVVAGGGGTALADSNHAIGDYSAIGGGRRNRTSGVHATVGGGYANSVIGDAATVGGGSVNTAVANHATVGGGDNNTAGWYYSTVGGGASNVANGWMSTIAGGGYNQCDSGGTVVGGAHNYARGIYSFIGGGGGPTDADSNCVTPDAYLGAVGGGRLNLVTAGYGTIGGGSNNTSGGFASTIAGGWVNSASGSNASAGGGEYNTAGGGYSTVPGGSNNAANGAYSFAAGRRAKAGFDGSFVWADHTDADFSSTNNDQFLIRASGHVGINTNNPLSPLHVYSEDHWRPSSGNGWGDFNVGNGTYGLCIGVALGGGGAGTVHIWPKGNAEQIIFASPTNGDLMIIRQNGHVGIGEFSAPNILTLPNVNSVEGRALGYAWDTYSSRRWKENISTIPDALDKVERLRGVEFDSKSNGEHDIGLIAEEVGAVIPEVVTFEENGIDAQSVDYSRLVAVLIEAVKEQQKQIDDLRTQIEEQTVQR